jgi:hypothetical protein
MFFPEGRSLGQRTMPIISQADDARYAKFRENLRWSIDGVMFVTLHIVGSNDNLGRTQEMDAEHRERKAANIAWLRQAFMEAKANSSRGLAVMTQANPNFENYWPAREKNTYLRMIPGTRASDKVEATGYDEYINVLSKEMESYTRPTVFLHGEPIHVQCATDELTEFANSAGVDRQAGFRGRPSSVGDCWHRLQSRRQQRKLQ